MERVEGNLTECSYVPYGNGLAAYRAVCHHAGAGVTYSTLAAGVPALVWPRDFDQFDNAARVVARGAGLRVKGGAREMAAGLRRLEGEPGFRLAAEELAGVLRGRDPVREVVGLLGGLLERGGGGGDSSRRRT